MTNPQMLVLAASAQALLTIVVLLVLGARRRTAYKAGKVGREAMLDDRVWPSHVLKASNNYKNLFEIPLLFFAAVATALAINAVSVVFVWLAWGFVSARIVHSICHCGSNKLPVRFCSFFTSVFAVTIMWAMLAAHVFSTGTI
ncbi:MAPEG family protein [Anderseniella sp. Alg231-50]|uniref:MAPEG family protein n=1 Tax=Anderseniella sp. Alg231-50 TaxID=1922226 RepID=UPI000D558AF9